jgi:hypothetical protein
MNILLNRTIRFNYKYLHNSIYFKIPKYFTTSNNGGTIHINKKENSSSKYEPVIDKKKIYKKKTHYRTLSIDNKLNPTASLEEQDERELVDWHKKKLFPKNYVKIMDDWQKNLINKKRKKAITKHNFENYVII